MRYSNRLNINDVNALNYALVGISEVVLDGLQPLVRAAMTAA